jgi:hypothetical protein
MSEFATEKPATIMARGVFISAMYCMDAAIVSGICICVKNKIIAIKVPMTIGAVSPSLSSFGSK